ncbi:MAG TPA: hypothetical protein VGD78_08020 [Chthoniobacterales bacterium]
MKSIFLFGTQIALALITSSAVLAGSQDIAVLSLAAPPAPESPIHWYFGETVASKNYHYSHGINNGDNGPYFQTDLNLFATLYRGNGFINQVKFNVFTWYQVTSQNEVPASHDFRRWNEFDANASIDVTFAKNFTFTVQSLNFFSPNNAFHEIHEVELALSYDDSWLLGPFALHPAVNYQKDFIGNGAIKPYGNLFELLAFPSVQAVKGGPLPVKLTFPLALGLGDNRFFGGNTFGYVASTVQADIGLGFIPKRFGSWTSTSTMTYYETNDAVAARNNGKNHQLVFTTGLNVSF